MTVTEPIRHLVVGRLRKPHGLKGNVAIFPLTSDPDLVFAAGQQVGVKGLDGEFVHESLTIEWSAKYHREWILKFKGMDVSTIPPSNGTRARPDDRSGCPSASSPA